MKKCELNTLKKIIIYIYIYFVHVQGIKELNVNIE